MRQNIYSAWIIPFGKGTEEVQTATKAVNKAEAKACLEAEGHVVVEITRHSNPVWAKSFYNLGS